MRNVVQPCLAVNNILLMRKRNHDLAIAPLSKMADRFTSLSFSFNKRTEAEKCQISFIMTFFKEKINK